MKVQHVGTGARPLLATLHLPQRLRPRTAAVLLCNPFGEEAARAHRIYRVLATQLERAGYAVMRFDYSGTGDAFGDDHDVTVDGWLADIRLAADELRAASGAKRVVVIGLRLGATLAALATRGGALRPRHLLLWDPVVDGAAYLRQLVDAHRGYMRGELDGWIDRIPVSAAGVPAEALGVAISPAFGAELATIDLAAEPIAADLVTVIRTHDDDGLARLQARLGTSQTTRWLELAGSVAWNSDAAINAAIVPMDIVNAIVARIEETVP